MRAEHFDAQMKTFIVSYQRYYGEMRDNFTEQFSAESEIDLLFSLLGGWGIIRSADILERDSKCDEFLKEVVDEQWTLEKFIKKHVGLWMDQDLCFEIQSIREGEIKYLYK